MKAPDLRSLLAIIDNPKDCPKKPNTLLLKIEKNWPILLFAKAF
jgi:hypothetical protein